ncbi:MAG: heme exporter protein CcmB [Alphaproteobacteria bacterium]|jgi:heme exporter protein B|nr:CcmB protein [alpha proteobacterium HIMB59]
MINNFFKLLANEFSLMIKGSIFTFVLFCLLMIASSIFSLALRHISFDIEIPLAFLWIMIFFISLIKVEKVYASDFSEAKLQQYILSPFALEIIIFVKNIMIYLNLLILFFIFSPIILVILNINLSYLFSINILLALSLLSIVFISSMTSSITISRNNKLSITSVLTLPLFVPILIFSMAISDVIDIDINKLYIFFLAYFLLNLAFSPLLTSFALKKLSV